MLHLHSTIAVILLIAILMSIILTFVNFAGNKPYNKKTALFGLIAAHIQFIVGIILYITLQYPSMINGAVMKDATLRFKLIEHPVAMIIGIIFITIGFSKAKRLSNPRQANKTVIIFYLLGLIFFLSRIPWSSWSLFQ